MQLARDSRQLKVVDRAVLALVAVFLILLAGLILAHGLGWHGAASLAGIVSELGGKWLESALLAAILLLAGLHVLFYCTQQEDDGGIRQETEMGHVQISLRAIETLVQRTAKTVRGIRDVDVRVHPSPEGVAVFLSVVALPEVPIPEISEEIGHKVRAQVRETMGILVGDVAIEIRNIAGEAKGRVE